MCYIDDIVITGSDDAEHLQDLDPEMECLCEHGVRLSRNQCYLMHDPVEHLGHRTDSAGLHALPAKIEVIIKALTPHNVQELQSFLDVWNYYGNFYLAYQLYFIY